jgi:undecaprenyl pyrophosphate phosphatase UppP
MTAAFVAGVLAIRFMLRYLQTRSLTIFVVYRLVLAAVVIVAWLR